MFGLSLPNVLMYYAKSELIGERCVNLNNNTGIG